jgi:hypothetical protein
MTTARGRPCLTLVSAHESDGEHGVIIPRVISLPKQDTVLIGRSRKQADIVVDVGHNTISRKHAELRMRIVDGQEQWSILDTGSTNGVFVNGVKVAACDLNDADVIQLGGAAMVPVGTVFAGNHVNVRYSFSSRKRMNMQECDSQKRRRSHSPPADHLSVHGAEAQDWEKLLAERVQLQREVQHLRGKLLSHKRIKQSNGLHAHPTGRSHAAIQVTTAKPEPSIVSSLLSLTQCPKCSLPIVNAVILPCAHTFCKTCWQSADGRCCPVCKRLYSLKERPERHCPFLDTLVDHIHTVVGMPFQRDAWKARCQSFGWGEKAGSAEQGPAYKPGASLPVPDISAGSESESDDSDDDR